MNTRRTPKRIAVGALMSGGIALAAAGLSAGTAEAVGGPLRWCPGQPLPGGGVKWDMSVCHTYYYVMTGQGNSGSPYIWDGPNPPGYQPPPNMPPLWVP
ncbi:conserved hypothetical secreted protein [Mycobacterium terramassiliense]|uniref:Conserved hypothetical secreted protein n=1 Tax=Mycobacterium terramassiliense TaxID=1841859 RepID=A0A2U3NIB9_9MYCO|nr:conserved hypothetical secreted protein [Mycobacterium terramassiliense]